MTVAAGTLERPFPNQTCTFVKPNGQTCAAWAVYGAPVCAKHGGNLPEIRKAAEVRVEQARAKLGLKARKAVDVIVGQIEGEDVPHYVRQKAAFGLLDRVGITPGHKTEVEVSGSIEHQHTLGAQTVLALLDRYAGASNPEIDAVEAEVIEDQPE